MRMLLAMLTLFIAAPATAGGEADPARRIDDNRITVSGISAGAAMAQQLHFAFPELFSGAGLIAPVPWGCAEGSVTTALGRCTKSTDSAMPVDQFLDAIRAAAEGGRIGDVSLLRDDRAWLFHGTLDAAVAEPVSRAAEAVYVVFLDREAVAWVGDVPAAHHFPTRDLGHACDVMEAPFVGSCDYDAAGQMLQFLYPGLESPRAETPAALQAVMLPGAASAGLAETAWLYLPESCPETGCRLHLVLHGCLQSEAQAGMQFMELSGYLPWAAANQILLAFPQVAASPVNPLGCWDWWGYTGAGYLNREAPQMQVLSDWIRSLRQ